MNPCCTPVLLHANEALVAALGIFLSTCQSSCSDDHPCTSPNIDCRHACHGKVPATSPYCPLMGPWALQKADIWSCGVILYAMLYGCYPFSNKEPDYIRKIVTATYHLPQDVQV